MTSTGKNVLLLGAGMVSDPLVAYFANKPGVHLTVATRSKASGQRLQAIGGQNLTLHIVNVETEIHVIETLIQKADLCISLLPYIYHATIAKICIQKGTNMLTSSYISPELQALDEAAKAAGVTVMNECGLDPGIDHMLAMQCFDQIHEAGGKVRSFVSFCGGLPAPEASDNPLRYKFSWSPRGMLLALRNPAKFLFDGKLVEVPEGGAEGGVLDQLVPIKFLPAFNFVGYPNRDSTKYADIYGLANGECRTLLRGTLRFQGFVEAMKTIIACGFLSTEKHDFLNGQQPIKWRQVTAKLVNCSNMDPKLFLLMMTKLRFAITPDGIEAMEQLGLLSDDLCKGKDTPLDTLAHHLAETLRYGPEERDLVVLNHDIQAQMADGVLEDHRITLIAYGEKFSAMARTVGYTTAIVADMLIKGEIKQAGMLRPVSKAVYEPVLKELAENFGIKASTKIVRPNAQQTRMIDI